MAHAGAGGYGVQLRPKQNYADAGGVRRGYVHARGLSIHGYVHAHGVR